MACSSPIWIRNRRYFDKMNPCRNGSDVAKSALALRPWDIARQWLMIPCGKCENCLRRQRNDWFVRLERELARCKAERKQAIFVTITIAPRYYNEALVNPSSFIRRWNERLRHRIGHSFKHAFFQEFGIHPETGSEPRLHFHGFLFATDTLYNDIRSAVSDLGFIWLSKATLKRARYCVKYVTKQIEFKPEDVSDKYVTINGTTTPLSSLLQHRRYTRKFVSAGVGDYLGIRPRPSARISSWSYLDSRTGVDYKYSIPRYYLRYLEQKDEILRSVAAADAYARFSKSPLVRHVVALCAKRFGLDSSLSRREAYSWEAKQMMRFSASLQKMPDFDPPTWLNLDILRFWRDHYKLQLLI
mgnify:CR=1 FL=1